MKKNLLLSILVALASFSSVAGQDKPAKFTVTVSTDSILMDNYFEVKFTVENAQASQFEAPDFSENFDVVSGPNHSTSMSIVNGSITQSMTITYYLKPRDIGAYYILPASVRAGGQIMETTPVEVFVHPNPDGIRQGPAKRQEAPSMWFNMPFDRFSPFGNDPNQPAQPTDPFGFDQFFRFFNKENNPQSPEGWFAPFGEGTDEENWDELLKQFQEQFPERGLLAPPPAAPAPHEEGDLLKKERERGAKKKTIRI